MRRLCKGIIDAICGATWKNLTRKIAEKMHFGLNVYETLAPVKTQG